MTRAALFLMLVACLPEKLEASAALDSAGVNGAPAGTSTSDAVSSGGETGNSATETSESSESDAVSSDGGESESESDSSDESESASDDESDESSEDDTPETGDDDDAETACDIGDRDECIEKLNWELQKAREDCDDEWEHKDEWLPGSCHYDACEFYVKAAERTGLVACHVDHCPELLLDTQREQMECEAAAAADIARDLKFGPAFELCPAEFRTAAAEAWDEALGAGCKG